MPASVRNPVPSSVSPLSLRSPNFFNVETVEPVIDGLSAMLAVAHWSKGAEGTERRTAVTNDGRALVTSKYGNGFDFIEYPSGTLVYRMSVVDAMRSLE